MKVNVYYIYNKKKGFDETNTLYASFDEAYSEIHSWAFVNHKDYEVRFFQLEVDRECTDYNGLVLFAVMTVINGEERVIGATSYARLCEGFGVTLGYDFEKDGVKLYDSLAFYRQYAITRRDEDVKASSVIR